MVEDQGHLLYTGEGGRINRVSLITGATDQWGSTALGRGFGLRILPGDTSEVLVAVHQYVFDPGPPPGDVVAPDSGKIVRIGPGASPVLQTYDDTGDPADDWFAVSIDPGLKTFWAAGLTKAVIHEFDIGTGQILRAFNAFTAAELAAGGGEPPGLVLGLCLKQEWTAAQELCSNGADDDGNGLIDGADPACRPIEICGNGIDEDGDGTDLSCSTPVLVEDCTDGADNDGDGQVDLADSDCGCTAAMELLPATYPECVALVPPPIPAEVCGDGQDNDLDGLTDEDCPPSVFDQTADAIEGQPVTITLHAIDPGISCGVSGADPLAENFEIVTQPTGGTLGPITILSCTPGDGDLPSEAMAEVDYTAGATWIPVDMFPYRTRDEAGNYSIMDAIVTINVTGVNNPPTGTSDAYTVNEDTPLNVAAPGVLMNDTDPDPEDVPFLTVELVTDVQEGALTLVPDGSFTYTPRTNFYGQDLFEYRVRDPDNATSGVVIVVITVDPVNDPPVAVTGGSATVLEDQATPLTLNGTDVDDLFNNPLNACTANFFVLTPVANGMLGAPFNLQCTRGSSYFSVPTVSSAQIYVYAGPGLLRI